MDVDEPHVDSVSEEIILATYRKDAVTVAECLKRCARDNRRDVPVARGGGPVARRGRVPRQSLVEHTRGLPRDVLRRCEPWFSASRCPRARPSVEGRGARNLPRFRFFPRKKSPFAESPRLEPLEPPAFSPRRDVPRGFLPERARNRRANDALSGRLSLAPLRYPLARASARPCPASASRKNATHGFFPRQLESSVDAIFCHVEVSRTIVSSLPDPVGGASDDAPRPRPPSFSRPARFPSSLTDASLSASLSPSSAKWGGADVTRVLLEAGAKVAQSTTLGVQPLHMAAQEGHVDVARLLVAHGAPCGATDRAGWSAFHYAANHRWATWRGPIDGQLAVLQLLAERGADVDAADGEGYTCAHSAAQSGKAEIIRLLRRLGARPDATTVRGVMPIHVAAEGGRAEVVDELLRWRPAGPRGDARFQRTQTDAPRRVPRTRGRRRGVTSTRRARVPRRRDRTRASGGRFGDGETPGDTTPLHLAARSNALDAVMVLLAGGANPRARGRQRVDPTRARGGVRQSRSFGSRRARRRRRRASRARRARAPPMEQTRARVVSARVQSRDARRRSSDGGGDETRAWFGRGYHRRRGDSRAREIRVA